MGAQNGQAGPVSVDPQAVIEALMRRGAQVMGEALMKQALDLAMQDAYISQLQRREEMPESQTVDSVA